MCQRSVDDYNARTYMSYMIVYQPICLFMSPYDIALEAWKQNFPMAWGERYNKLTMQPF